MRPDRISRLIKGIAGPVLLLRAGVVGGNFIVMLGLAWFMGLSAFGVLMVLWGLAMVAATVVSVGAPLLLLRVMADGTGLRAHGLVRQVVVYPVGLAVLGALILPVIVPGVTWFSVMIAALAINGVSCVASMMRALGQVKSSMALRDAGPHLSLGLAACLVSDIAGMLIVAAGLMTGLIVLGAIQAMRHPRWQDCVNRDGDRGALHPGLWMNSVLGMVTAQIDIVLGGSFMASDQIGLYALVRRVANLVALPVSVATWISAAPIAVAFGAGDRVALRRASAAGSKAALLPGCILFAAALIVLPFWPGLAHAKMLGVILLSAAFIQVMLASGFTVATLCGLERYALWARTISIALYCGCVAWAGFSATGNALAYLVGVLGGGILLWWLLWRRLQIDTSALAIWPGPRGQACKLH